MGDLSPHFSLSEFADRRTGDVIAPPAALVAVLEQLRRRIGRPLPIVSGYRSAATNRAVGGAARSLHRSGRAADIPGGMVTLEQAIAAGARGIGLRQGWVVHVDTRRSARPVIFADP